MRSVRPLGLLLAIAAVAVLAVAAAPASASTVLCKTAESPCEAQKYPGGQAINSSIAEGTKFKFTSGFITVQCSSGTIDSRTRSEAGSPLSVRLTGVTLSNCTANLGGTCTAGGYGVPRTTTLAATGSGNGSLNVGGAGIEFTCVVFGTPVTCRYAASAEGALSVSGGSPASLTATNLPVSLASGHGLCSKTATITASYRVTSPNPLYVATGSGSEQLITGLCSQNTSPCPAGSQYFAGDTLEAATSGFVFSFVGVTVTCSSSLKGEITGASAEGATVDFSSTALSGCSQNAPGYGTCTGSLDPGVGTTAGTGGGNGTIVAPLVLTFDCSAGFHCVYEASAASLPFTGGSPAVINAVGIPMTKREGSSAFCQNTLSWSAKYTFSQPSSLYMV